MGLGVAPHEMRYALFVGFFDDSVAFGDFLCGGIAGIIFFLVR